MRARGFLVVASVALVFVLLGGVLAYVVSEASLQQGYPVPASALVLRVEPTSLLEARGRHVATAISQCQFCHGPNLGGVRVIDTATLGRLYAANLTQGSGGVGATYGTEDWVRAIRFGVGREGRSLLLQPSRHLSAMSDSDLAAVISYLRRVPAVHAQHPVRRIGPLIRIALALGLAADLLAAPAVDRDRKSPIEIPVERTVAYGAYLTEIGNCRFCHRSDLQGGLHSLARSGEPEPPDLTRTGSMAGWSEQDFALAMRTGQTRDGRQLDPDFMPWQGYAKLNALEIDALWLYLRSLGGADADADWARGKANGR